MLFLGTVSCGNDDTDPPEKDSRPKNLQEYLQVSEGLKDYYPYTEYFYIGVAIEPATLNNAADVALMKRHFSSLAAENVMKWSALQPSEGTFNFAPADALVTFAEENGICVRGHTLCWHNQVPAWVFKDGNATASKELVLQRLASHITTVMTHFKGKIYAWDVVNEAIDDGSRFYRTSPWYNICSEDYIFKAFETARTADPEAKLFYNDYSELNPVKRDKIYELLSQLKARNLVDGMGLQGHWNIEYPSDAILTAALDKYRSLDIELHITELDVSVYPSTSDPEIPYTEELGLTLAAAYGRLFSTFRNYKEHITSVTFWGLTDNHTWLDNFPVPGRKNYPLLFDTNYNPKQAYFTVINF